MGKAGNPWWKTSLHSVPSVTLPLNTLPPAGWAGRWAAGLTELGSECHALLVLRPVSSSSCVCGDQAVLRDRLAPIALGFSQRSWAGGRTGHPGVAGKRVQASGPPPPRPGCGVGPRRVEVPTAQLPHWLPEAAGPGRASQQQGVGRDSSCLGQDPVSGPGQPLRHPPLTFILHLDGCQWSCQPALPRIGGSESGIHHCRPCLSQAETVLPDRPAPIHHVPRAGVGIVTNGTSFNPHISLGICAPTPFSNE